MTSLLESDRDRDRERERDSQKERWSSDHRNAETDSVLLFSNARQSRPKNRLGADLQDPTVTAASDAKICFILTSRCETDVLANPLQDSRTTFLLLIMLFMSILSINPHTSNIRLFTHYFF